MTASDRLYSLDTFRTVAIFFVVTIHTHPFRGFGVVGNVSNFVIDGFARFGVPLFFVISGYLFAMKLSDAPDPNEYFRRYTRKIVGIYAFATVFYIAAIPFVRSWIRAVDRWSTPGSAVVDAWSVWWATVSDGVAQVLLGNPLNLLYYGTAANGKLWFLTALSVSITLVYLFRTLDLGGYLLPTALVLHIWGLFGETYYFAAGNPFRSRDALFFGFFYVSVGYAFYRLDRQIETRNSWKYLGAFGLASFLHLAERYAIGYTVLGNDISRIVYTTDFQFTTVFVVVSLFLFLLSNPRLGADSVVSDLGKYAVGIYVLHPGLIIVVDELLASVDYGGPQGVAGIAWELAYTPGLFVGSVVLYVLLGRAGVIEYFYVSEFASTK